MTDVPNPLPEPERPLDRLVRARLDADAQDVDAEALLARVRARLAENSPTPAAPARPARRRRWGLLVPVAAAASVMAAFFLMRPGEDIQASPARMIEEAKKTHSQGLDRCYRVRFDLAPEISKRYPFLAPSNEETLWTRGDQFWVAPSFTGRGAWGRDARDRVWVVPVPRVGVVFEPAELPPALDEVLKVRSLQLPTLLDDVLNNCDLEFLPAEPDTPPNVRRIRATPKADAPAGTLKRAVIEVEQQAHVVRRLVLERVVAGADLVTVTFTLTETRTLDAGVYEVSAHVADDAALHVDDAKDVRLRILLKHGLRSLFKKAS